MSLYQFLASDIPLKEVKNPFIEFLSINAAMERGVIISELLLNNNDIDRDNYKAILICDSEEHMYEIEINQVAGYSSANQCSSKQYIYELSWMFTEERALQLLSYIREHLNICKEIELWNIWLNDDQIPSVKYLDCKELTIKDIRYIYGKDEYYQPECLVIASS